MRKILLYVSLILVSGFLITPMAFAAGTPVGTNISNQAFGDYKDANGNSLARVFSNTVTTAVSQVAGLDVTPPSATSSGANLDTTYFLVDVENLGNGDDTFDFTYSVTSGWNPTSVSFYFDVNGNGVFDAGTDTLIGTGAGPHSTGTVSADGIYPILMGVEIPDAGTAPDGSTSVIRVTATSQLDGTVTDFGDYTALVSTAVITAVKTHAPTSPGPGDTLIYTITLTNTGTTDGTTTLVNDPIPAGLTYLPGSITVDGVSKTDASDGDNADFNGTVAGAVYVDVGTIAAGGGSVVITFQATVNTGIAAGTPVTNQATVNYQSGATPITVTTNGDTFNVGTAGAIAVIPDITIATGDPGDQIIYPVTVTNNGNGADAIDLTYNSTAGWTWDLWFDANDDGIPGNDGDFLLTDTDGDGLVDTGAIGAGNSASILAVATIPAGTTDGTIDTLVITGTSSVDTGISDTSGNLNTTVTAPVLGLVKTVSPSGPQPPGTELTYTITATNNGTGVATDVIITDLIPAFTTYKAGSIETGSSLATLTNRTDAVDGDGAEFESGSNAVVAGGTGSSLGPGGMLVLQFTVIID